MLMTEFRANENWGDNMPVHPEVSVDDVQPYNSQVGDCDVLTTSKLPMFRWHCTYLNKCTQRQTHVHTQSQHNG